MKNQLLVATYSDPECPCPARLKDWWDKIEAWAEALAVPLNEVCGRFKTKPNGLVHGNGYNLARYRSRFVRQLEEGNIEELQLMRLSEAWRYKTLDWDFEAGYGRFDCEFGIVSTGIRVDCLRSIPDMSLASFVHDAVHLARPYLRAKYGFAVVMPEHFMPAGYAIGLAARLPEDMVHECNAWMKYMSKECHRSIRNVFGYNILNREHLDIPVGGRRFEDWIKASAVRGRIEPLEDGLFLWTFQEGDDREAFLHWDFAPVVHVRQELIKRNVFPWVVTLRERQAAVLRARLS